MKWIMSQRLFFIAASVFAILGCFAPPSVMAQPDAAKPGAVAVPTTADPVQVKATLDGTDSSMSELERVRPFTDTRPSSYWMPAKGSKSTEHVDWMFYAILGLSIFCFVAITVAVLYLTWRYRHRPGHVAQPSTAHDNVLEVVWTVIPSIICVFIFIGGWKGYLNMTTAPGDAMEINVVGQKWFWSFDYPYGQETLPHGELHVPVDRPVKLIMRSEDVLHSFFLPSMRVKQDVIPNRYTYLWFQPDVPGVYRVYCAEYCGDAHWDMKTKLVVHKPGEYEKWLEELYDSENQDCAEEFPGDDNKAARDECYLGKGEKLYVSKGCKQCHSTDGSSATGPSFKGMWGQTRQFSDGTSGSVDENYVRESVLDPMVKVRAGFNPVMPTFKDKLKNKDIDALIHWMKTL